MEEPMKTRSMLVIPIFALSALAFADEGDTAETMKMLDSDGDGRVSATEYTASPGKTRAEFARIDRDADGYLTAAEMDAHRTAKKASEEAEEEER
jgi:Ca2+-binding EF-hand superfamily protein